MSKKRNTAAATPATGATAAGPNYKIQQRVDAAISTKGDGPQPEGESATKMVIAWLDGNPTYGSKVLADKALDAMEMSGVYRVIRVHPAFLVEVEQRNIVTSRKPAE